MSWQEAKRAANNETLTKREDEVLHLLAEGLTHKDIGHCLYISPETVRKHLMNIYKKLDAHNKIKALRKMKLL